LKQIDFGLRRMIPWLGPQLEADLLEAVGDQFLT
jgi:hypothetical protein